MPKHGCAFVKILSGTTPIAEPAATWFPKPPDKQPIAPLPRTGWTATTDVDYPYSENIANLFDGNLGSYPNEVQNLAVNLEHNVTIDMKAKQTFNCVVLSNSSDGTGPALKPYVVYRSVHWWRISVSDDGATWRGPVDSGWAGPMNYASFTFPEQTARYIKILHKLVNMQSTIWAGCSDKNQAGFCGRAIGEIYVADVPAVSARYALSEASFAIAPRRAAPKMVVCAGARGPSLVSAIGARIFSIDGRHLDGMRPAANGHERAGILIVK